MRGRAALRPVSLTARVGRLEREMRVTEPYESMVSRGLAIRWLFGCEEAAELYDDYLAIQETLAPVKPLAAPEGRTAILAMVTSLYEFEPPAAALELVRHGDPGSLATRYSNHRVRTDNILPEP